jgi:hypothetical protein
MVKANKKVKKPVIVYMSVDAKNELKAFIFFALGDPELTAYEANFIARMRQLCDYQFLCLSEKQQVIIQQIKEKLRYKLPPFEVTLADTDDFVLEADDDGIEIIDERAYLEIFGPKSK